MGLRRRWQQRRSCGLPHFHNVGRSLGFAVVRPSLHEIAAFFKRVGAAVRLFGFVADRPDPGDLL